MFSSLDQLGWSARFSNSLPLQDLERAEPARVVEVQRDRFTAIAERGRLLVPAAPGVVAPDGLPVTVGDWVLVERDAPRLRRILPRLTLVARAAAGATGRRQPIAANVDTLFVVTSCNDDFNPSRLERYLAIARETAVSAVLLLTRADLCADPEEYLARARAIDDRLEVIALDARAPDAAVRLGPWLGPGQTVAFAGSSGVGKSTLVNTLLHAGIQRTAGIREDDARGRHTTTSRRLFALPSGAWVIDTPGMRELAVGPVSRAAMAEVFEDLTVLARGCRFRDCRHEGDAGCALAAAVAAGEVDARRLASFLKLRAEADRAMRTEAERRSGERRFGRLARAVLRDKRRRRDVC